MFRIHDILGWIRIRGSMPLTNGSGSCYFRHWPSRCQQKLICNTIFSAYYLLFEGTFTSFFKDKKSKSHKIVGIHVFSYYFCMIIEGSGSRAGSGSIPLTSGSGSGRPKNMLIRWIRIRIRIRDPEHWLCVGTVSCVVKLRCLVGIERIPISGVGVHLRVRYIFFKQ